MSEISVFKELIQRNPDICSNCFRRLFDRYEKNYYVGQQSGDLYVAEIRDSISPIVSDERHGVDVVEAHSDSVTRGMTVSCECGSISHYDTTRPKSGSEIIEMTKRLCERMDEEHVNYQKDVLYGRVRDMMDDPDQQGKQDEMFDSALHDAIEVEST